MFDISQQLTAEVLEVQKNQGDPALVTVSVPYLLLLNHVSSLKPSKDTAARQFAVVLSPGVDINEKPRTVFVSGLHAVE